MSTRAGEPRRPSLPEGLLRPRCLSSCSSGSTTTASRGARAPAPPAAFASSRTCSKARNPDGSPALFSLYAATRYIEAPDIDTPEHVRAAWRAIADAGHEIGLHTHSHSHGKSFDTRQWSEEIAECKRWLGEIGVQPDEIFGFRAPFLEYGRPLFPALHGQGVLYDCSVEEGFDDRFHGGNLPWPYRIEEELWEIPVYALTVPPDEECERYGVPPGLRARLHQVQGYFDPADGKITGFDWNLWMEFGMTRPEVVATFKYSLDLRLAGNRAPLTFGNHSDIYSEQYASAAGSTAEDRRQALAEILDYALSRPEVRVVTAKQILDWLRNPVPL